MVSNSQRCIAANFETANSEHDLAAGGILLSKWTKPPVLEHGSGGLVHLPSAALRVHAMLSTIRFPYPFSLIPFPSARNTLARGDPCLGPFYRWGLTDKSFIKVCASLAHFG